MTRLVPPRFRGRLSSAHVMSALALFISLGGASYAALRLPANSVGAAQIRSGAVGASELRNGSIKAEDLAAPARAGGTGPRGPVGPAGTKGADGQDGKPGPPASSEVVSNIFQRNFDPGDCRDSRGKLCNIPNQGLWTWADGLPLPTFSREPTGYTSLAGAVYAISDMTPWILCLPSGYRPPDGMRFNLAGFITTTSVEVAVTTHEGCLQIDSRTGDVRSSEQLPGGSVLFLDGIRFRAGN